MFATMDKDEFTYWEIRFHVYSDDYDYRLNPDKEDKGGVVWFLKEYKKLTGRMKVVVEVYEKQSWDIVDEEVKGILQITRDITPSGKFWRNHFGDRRDFQWCG